MTREHLFAKWVRDAYINDGRPAIEFAVDDSIKWAYRGDALDQKVKAFCGKCNNGWMSDLEVRTAPVMRPILRAEQVPVKMDALAQGTVASWATKTAFVLDQMHPAEHRIPAAYYRAFYESRQPSSDVLVILGARHIPADSNGRANLFDYRSQFVGGGSSGFQHIHFVVGAVYLGVLIKVNFHRQITELKVSDAVGRCLELIWPVCAAEVVWPRPSISEIGGVQGVFKALTDAIPGRPSVL